MKGFIVYPAYQIIDSGPKIFLFGRLENGQSFLTINSYEPYFFVEESELKKAGSILKEYNVVKTDFKNFNEKKVVKIMVDIPATVPILRKKLEDKGIKCYEADIRFAYRYLIDKDIKGSINIEGDYETSEYVDRIYYEPTINPADFIPKLKVFSLDIETSPDNKKIYSVAIYAESIKKVFLISDKKIKDFFAFKDEGSLLEEFRKTIIEEDPDIITGWGVVDFDLMVLKEKFREYQIPFVLGRTDKQCTIRKAKGFFMASKADFPGRMVLDGVNVLRESFVKLDDYKLSSASSKFLGDKKTIGDNNKVEEIEKLFAKDREKLAEYNLKDAELVYRILEKLNIINLSIKRSLLTGMQLDRVGASISSIDSLYIRESRKKDYVVVSSEYGIKEKPITGGYVMESLPGIYDNLVIMDFKSLYPSIIRTFAIDPFLYVGKKGGKNLVIAPNKAAFRNEEGILPKIISTLMKERKIAISNKDELTSYAIKIHINSMFGVLANPTYRFFNLDIANAITTFGQFIIKLTAKKIEELGYKVIYQDTDSSFILSSASSSKEAEKIGLGLQDKINIFFKDYIKKEYMRESCLELEFKKVYSRFLMPMIRHSEKGAKKRYAGLIIDDSGKEKLEFVGMEFVRADWTEAAQIFQKELFDRIFHKKEVANFIRSYVEDLKKGRFDDKLVYKKQLRKGLTGYSVNPPHLKAAKKLKNFKGGIIEYYITTDGPEPVQELKHKIDYDYYINRQIKPVADSILVFFNTDLDTVIRESKQTTLFKYS